MTTLGVIACVYSICSTVYILLRKAMIRDLLKVNVELINEVNGKNFILSYYHVTLRSVINDEFYDDFISHLNNDKNLNYDPSRYDQIYQKLYFRQNKKKNGNVNKITEAS